MMLTGKYQSLSALRQAVDAADEAYRERCSCGAELKRTNELARGVCYACQLKGVEREERRKKPLKLSIQRAAIFKRQHGFCYSCGCVMTQEGYGHRIQPDNLAVLFHLDSKYSRERGKHFGEFRRVVVCRRCSDAWSREEQASVPINELHVRAGHEESNDE